MKAIVKSSELSKALKLCSNTVDLKDSTRSNVEIVAEDQKLMVNATNTTFSTTIILPSEVEEEGVAVVDSGIAYGIVAKGTGECVLTSNDKNLTIKTSGKTNIPNIQKVIPMIESTKGKTVTCDSIEFKTAINKVSYAIATEESRIILTGAHIVSNGEEMIVTGLDGFRLAQTRIKCHGDSFDIIVPLRVLNMICDASTDGELTINVNNIHMTARGNGYIINSVLISGSYVDTSRIIPTNFTTKVLIDTARLMDLADSATIASSSNNLVTLDVRDGKITVLSRSEKAEFNGDIDALIDGEYLTIAFNLKYLIQMLKHIGTEKCDISFTTSVSPAIFTPQSNPSDINLILPVRTFQ